MYRKNEELTVQIEDLTREGEGIGRIDGYTLFVKDALPGDLVRVRLTKVKPRYAWAKMTEILTASPDRVSAVCPSARRCGGCRLQELSYEAQLRFKEQYVRETLSRIGGFPNAEVRPVIGMEQPFRFRNKAQYPIANVKNADGTLRPAAGFYAGRTHFLVETEDCVLTPEVNADIVKRVLAHMARFDISPYDEAAGSGLMRHLLIRHGFATGEILVCPVINGEELPHADEFCAALLEVPGVKSICLNVNRKRGNVILGDRVIPLYGDPWIEDVLMGRTFRISPRSFYQVNPGQTEKLYAEALRAAALSGKETVYDLYCGIGTISLCMAANAMAVYGIEIVPDAVRDARENARRNGVDNAWFYEGAAEELVSSGELAPGIPLPQADVVMLDPPRKGCARELLSAVLRMAPERIVYVSCDPATLARDLRILADGEGDTRYELRYAQPTDLFGHSCHVETVCLLSNRKRKPDSYVKVSLDMEDYYKIKDEQKAKEEAE